MFAALVLESTGGINEQGLRNLRLLSRNLQSSVALSILSRIGCAFSPRTPILSPYRLPSTFVGTRPPITALLRPLSPPPPSPVVEEAAINTAILEALKRDDFDEMIRLFSTLPPSPSQLPAPGAATFVG